MEFVKVKMMVYARAMRLAGGETPIPVLLSQPSKASPAQRTLSVLAIDEWLPYPLDSGKRVRTWNLLSRMARRHHVVLLCFGDGESPAAAAIRSAGVELQTIAPPQRVEGWRLYADLLAN